MLIQRWRDVVFLHWPVEPRRVAPLLPRSVVPDLVDGRTYVGLIALRMCRVGPPGLPVPYLGWFPEVNVRVYSVGPDGRRGVVFLSLDAARLIPAMMGRAGLRLPYLWSRIRASRERETVSYASGRRWPGPAGARLRLMVDVGEPVTSPSPLEHFLTARWGLHVRWYGAQSLYVPNEHPAWPLRRATLRGLDENLIGATGLPAPTREPVSVLYAPEVRVRAGLPERLPGQGGRRFRDRGLLPANSTRRLSSWPSQAPACRHIPDISGTSAQVSGEHPVITISAFPAGMEWGTRAAQLLYARITKIQDLCGWARTGPV